MRYATSINILQTEWQNDVPSVTRKVAIAYSNLMYENKLSAYDYKPVLGWTYENDDFIQNWITLVITAVDIKEMEQLANEPQRYTDVTSK